MNIFKDYCYLINWEKYFFSEFLKYILILRYNISKSCDNSKKNLHFKRLIKLSEGMLYCS